MSNPNLTLLDLIVALTVAFVLSNISTMIIMGETGKLRETFQDVFGFMEGGDDMEETVTPKPQQRQLNLPRFAKPNDDYLNPYKMTVPYAYNTCDDSGRFSQFQFERDPNNVYQPPKHDMISPEGVAAGSKYSFVFNNS